MWSSGRCVDMSASFACLAARAKLRSAVLLVFQWTSAGSTRGSRSRTSIKARGAFIDDRLHFRERFCWTCVCHDRFRKRRYI